MDNQPQTEFRPLLYDRKHLIVKTTDGAKAVVIAECYLPEIADQICRLLTESAEEMNEPNKPDKGETDAD